MTERCPIRPFDRAAPDYAVRVQEWLADPHRYFRAFGPEARAFQRRNASERLRTMTLVAPASEFVALRPVCVSVDGLAEQTASWEELFSCVARRLLRAHPFTFAALQQAGELEWLGCPAEGEPVARVFAAGALQPQFADLAEVVGRIQWMFLMCGFRLNEVVVQVDPYTDEDWAIRAEVLRRRRAERRAKRQDEASVFAPDEPHF